jgi:ATP-dependent Lon protease
MSERPNRIPLFPLDVVLLPGTALPLHIFEPRYKKMIRLCLTRQLEFGMIFARENRVSSIGCTAEILQKLKDYDDGQMDILTEGRAAFRMNELLDEKEYHEAIVEYLPEEAEAPQDPGEEAQLIELFRQCHAALFGQAWTAESPELAAGVSLAYRIAAVLPLAPEEKQGLLEMREEARRRNFLFNRMTQILPQMIRRQQIRKSAAGNGHGAN